MSKRITAIVTSLVLALNGLIFFPKQEIVHAEELQGYWKLVDVTDIYDMPTDGEYFYEGWNVDDKDSEWKYHEHHLQKKTIPGSNYDVSGETMDHYVNLSPLADTYHVGDVIELEVDYHFETNIPLKTMGTYTGALGGIHEMECVPNAWQTIRVWIDEDTRPNYGLRVATGGLGAGSKPPTIFESETVKIEVTANDELVTSERNIDSSAVIRKEILEPNYKDDILLIGCNMDGGGRNCSTVYVYEWVDESETPPVEPYYKDRGYWQLTNAKSYSGDTSDNAFTSVKGRYYHNYVHNGNEWVSHIILAPPLKDIYFAGDKAEVHGDYVFETNLSKDMGKDIRDEIIGLQVSGYYQEHDDDLETVEKINESAGDLQFTDADGNPARITSGHNSDDYRYESDWSNTNYSKTLFATMPEGHKNGEKLYIDYHFTTAQAPDAYTVYEYEWHTAFVQGDINGDGELTVADVILLQKWLLAVPNTHLTNWKTADFCEDGILNVFDLCLMKRELLKK